MRRLAPPAFGAAEVYSACAADVPGAQLAAAYTAATEAMMLRAEEYRTQATSASLHMLAASDWGNADQVVVGALTKGNLKTLYEKGMVKGSNGRLYYDMLLASAPLGKCPYCRFGHAETLDHFLPKSRYPSYSVLPINLVPACMRCNTGKAGGPLTAAGEMSHPYFEGEQVEDDVWLVAAVIQTNPVTVNFSVVIPNHWPDDLGRRVTNYFSEFDLAIRYAVEAASELVSVSAYLRALPSPDVRHDHLQRAAGVERGISRNSWKAAMYAALAASVWYSQTGCELIGVPQGSTVGG